MTTESMSESAPHEGDVVWRPTPDFARESGMTASSGSAEEPEGFWDAVGDFAGILGAI